MTTAVLSQSPSQVEPFHNCNQRSHHSQNSSYSLSTMQIQYQQPPTFFDHPLGPSRTGEQQLQQHGHVLDVNSNLSCCRNERRSSVSSSPYKTVRFSIEPTKIIPHLHWKDMTEEEIEATWLTYADKRRFRREAALTKKLVRRGTIFNDNINSYNSDDLSVSSYSSSSSSDNDEKEIELCYRGLESRRHKLIKMTRRVVFSVQERHHAKQQEYLDQEQHYNDGCTFGNYDDDSENYLEYEKMVKIEHLTIADRYKNINQDAAILARERARQDSHEVSRC